ncbi:rhomboid family intramembrane serine protease [Rhodococcus sp. IEGM 1408]|uniref:rhomboid family intramembrane serine protease n=1 Tax=Rhodococcus sp. IEGM 1408 TaxID=3082220 RepID=UPI00295380FD|nr:rhomboid family intramembrane serine protease [Rhodococcus sp. IEGM 1408]MDV8000132.1 rhomboid family intramembrane serine protease [Rhodococcus sp. IEGM 1408]
MTTQTYRGGAVSRFFRLQPVTAWLIAANFAVYAATVAQARSLLGNNASALFEATALYPPLVVVWDEWWRLLTSAFQHFGPVHILLNMYMLWILGVGIERSIGHLRFLALYLVSALGGSVAVMFFSQNALTAGASGAIFGLMGAYAIVAVSMRLDAKGILLLLVMNIGVSFLVPGVSLAAHLGGLVVGALGAFALVVLPRRLPTRVGRGGRETVSWVGYLVVVALVAGAARVAADTMSVGFMVTG